MSKVQLFIVVLWALLWAEGSYAQNSHVLTLEQMFALADENSKTIKAEEAAVTEAQQTVKAAKNGCLPDIDISLSTCYLGNGYLLDREFLNGQSVSMSHFGNNFAIKVTQLIYAGGADKGFMVIV